MRQTALHRLILICIILCLWIVLFLVDFSRCSTLQDPLFAIPMGIRNDDGGSRIHLGLGYTVTVTESIDFEHGLCICRTELRLLGIVPLVICES